MIKFLKSFVLSQLNQEYLHRTIYQYIVKISEINISAVHQCIALPDPNLNSIFIKLLN
jgi:hypothetical protein